MRKAKVLELWIAAFIFLTAMHLTSSQVGMSNDVIMVNSGLKRHKRSEDVIEYGLTSQEVYDAVNVHNELRRFINASNMEFMVSANGIFENLRF